MSYTLRTYLHRFRKNFAEVNRLNKVEPQMMNLYITNFANSLGLGYRGSTVYKVKTFKQ